MNCVPPPAPPPPVHPIPPPPPLPNPHLIAAEGTEDLVPYLIPERGRNENAGERDMRCIGTVESVAAVFVGPEG